MLTSHNQPRLSLSLCCLLFVPCVRTEVGGYRSTRTDLKRTHGVLSSRSGGQDPPPLNGIGPTGAIRKISSVEGLTEDEQNKIAEILVSLFGDRKTSPTLYKLGG